MDDDERKLFEMWRGLGLSMRASNMLAIFTDATSPAAVYALGPASLMGLPNVGKVTVTEIGRVLFAEDWATEPYRTSDPLYRWVR